jgi:LmbE family N-acetylglucosaminyl deacetylase
MCGSIRPLKINYIRMKIKYLLLIISLAIAFTMKAQEKPLNIVVFGAHPDDCDNDAGGTAIKFVHMGHHVMFVSLCNGDAGTYKYGRRKLAGIRRKEAQEAGKRFGVKYIVLNHHDCELMPDLKLRHEVIRLIREWNADIVISPRPNDYMADHRSTATVVQDAAYMVIVPHCVPCVPALKKNPLFLYCEDNFKKPLPFSRDIVVDISDVLKEKIYAMSAHKSQYFDWLPWTNGELEKVPKGEKERLDWLFEKRSIGPDNKPKYYEAFEICEYGRQPSKDEIKSLFPMIGK